MLFISIKTVRIDGELMEIWPNEVCDTEILGRSTGNHHGTVY